MGLKNESVFGVKTRFGDWVLATFYWLGLMIIFGKGKRATYFQITPSYQSLKSNEVVVADFIDNNQKFNVPFCLLTRFFSTRMLF